MFDCEFSDKNIYIENEESIYFLQKLKDKSIKDVEVEGCEEGVKLPCIFFFRKSKKEMENLRQTLFLQDNPNAYFI